ncbi:hypothetical protein CAEBREN_15703 [Caenorhabditis brenneri]|uniref:Uncharacterized protein n=1 Tax=Caenorhabditis brenneri TaxID=135651 RepID=G0P7N8_CAEBE|nr:hypothetical protein CAEBREN_15703 [Caenorhabditis brenneri]
MSPRAADYSENWEGAKGLTSEIRSSGSTVSPVKSSPRGIRRRSSDRFDTAPLIAAINSVASSSLDIRQHIVQVGNHIDYMESESNALQSFNNYYLDWNMSSRASELLENKERPGDSLVDEWKLIFGKHLN